MRFIWHQRVLRKKKQVPGRRRNCHLTLLAKNQEGWNQLQKLVTVAHLKGKYYGKPRIDRQLLEQYSQGVICLSGCLQGPVNEWILAENRDKAREEVEFLSRVFGEDFYLELQNHYLEAQQICNQQLLEFSKELELKVVATNDVHFLNQEDHDAHDTMLCIGTAKLLQDEKRMRYSEEVYLKSSEEMRTLFAEVPQACDMTLEIADKVDVKLELDPTSSDKYPQFSPPEGQSLQEHLTQQCYEGLTARYAERAEEEALIKRLKYEIETISDLGFASYFLIIADFLNWARGKGIPVGPGRGSAAGSLVAYVLRITEVCPIRFGLLFERFLNPERVSPPDVDIDFCQARRGEVIEYVRNRYGNEQVAHIITHGKLRAKNVIRDVARVMGIPYGEADRLAKMIEIRPGVTLQEEHKRSSELREAIAEKQNYQELWRRAISLEGLTRNVGVHAAGVVIGDRPLSEYVPLTTGNDGEVITQYDMGGVADYGLLKMDFLGLKNLTVIEEAVGHIKKANPKFKIEEVLLEDQKTFDLLNRGETMGVFQLESSGMVETCRKYGIERIEDIIDLLALYRPGAMQFIDRMIEVKKGQKAPIYEHPLLEEICGETHGVMIYQEQVQNAAKLLAGYTLGGADILRRAMSKKKPEEMAQQREIFVRGCEETNGISHHLANKIFDKIDSFAGYGVQQVTFNLLWPYFLLDRVFEGKLYRRVFVCFIVK